MAKVGEQISRVEREAVEFVLAYERAQGRDPVEVRRQGCDVISSGRKIEVKGKGAPDWGSVRLAPQVFKVVRESPEFFLYVVANIDSGNPEEYKLYIFDKDEILQMAEEWSGPWVVKVPKKERDRYRVRDGTRGDGRVP